MAKGMSRGLKITLSIIGVIVVFILLVMVVGAIGDATARGRLDEIRNSSLAFLESYIRKEEGNAEQFFAEAAAYAEDVTVDFYPYLDGTIEITPGLTKAILDNLDAIARVEQGAQMEFHSYPYAYQKAAAAELPPFFNMSKAVKLTCAKALFDMEQGRSDQSLNALLHVVRAGRLIASDTPALLDVMMGNSLAMYALNVLQLGLESGGYDQDQLERIEKFLEQCEREWPPVGLSLKGDVCGMAITLFDVLRSSGGVLQMGELLTDSFGDVFRLFILRLMCWRYSFSPVRMYLSGHESISGIVDEFNHLEDIPLTEESWEERNLKYAEFREHLKQALEGNLILKLAFPNVFGIYNSRLETLTMIRAERLACAIFAFQRDNRRFPVDLKEMGGDLIYDFNTGKSWTYKNDGESATISSPGPNPELTKGDITITLTNLGIKPFLRKLRATEGK
jgi:hypothetical protein